MLHGEPIAALGVDAQVLAELASYAGESFRPRRLFEQRHLINP
jgi:hypothetical protein